MEHFPKIQQLTFKGLGTEIDLQIVVEDSKQSELAQADLFEIKKEYARIEKIFSRFDPNSELSGLNTRPGEHKKVSAWMLAIAKKALLHSKETDGIFDSRILCNLEAAGYDKDFDSTLRLVDFPITGLKNDCSGKLADDLIIDGDKVCFKKRMDFSGIVKGWATDLMTGILVSKGWKNFLVDSGGDIYFSGLAADGKKWKVDIEGIAKKSLLLELSEKGVATSGIGKRKWERGGKRYHHILNPKNPDAFSFEVQSVTVVDNTTECADVWAKTLFILGKDSAKDKAKEKNLACVILEYSGRAWVSPQMKQYIFTQ